MTLEGRNVRRAAFRFVRHNDRNETIFRTMREEQNTARKIAERSAPFKTRIEIEGDEAVLRPLG